MASRRVTADERDWETCVEPDCGNRVARFAMGDFYCQPHAPTGHGLSTTRTSHGRTEKSKVRHIALRVGAIAVAQCDERKRMQDVRSDLPSANYWDRHALCRRCFGDADRD